VPHRRPQSNREENHVRHKTTISLRRRHLMLAGVAGVLAPAGVFAAHSGSASSGAPVIAVALAEGSRDDGRLVVSGRIVGPDRKPLADAAIEVRLPGATTPHASTTTDADGRFMFTTATHAARDGDLQPLIYRVSHPRHAALETRLDFARTQLQRDEAGAWRATMGLALA
jgi:hypothetical protein